MAELSEIEPHETPKPNVIDLVRDAGVDVTDWANCNTDASRNPKYCYEWAFIQPNRVVVLNLWHGLMRCNNGIISSTFNYRLLSEELVEPRKARSLSADAAVQFSITNHLPIRVIALKEKDRGIYKTASTRLLDPVPWAVTEYNQSTGDCVLTRGSQPGNTSPVIGESAVNDIFNPPEGAEFPDRAARVGTVIIRDSRVRAHVLRRANGNCEYCNTQGFLTSNGRHYVETHHIIALAQAGRDTIDNVIALCPQHHRQAHYGTEEEAERLEAEFIGIVTRQNAQT